MRNSVSQSDGKSLLQLGDWYLGIYVDTQGNLAVHIDHANGAVKSYDSDNAMADDHYQWAELFYVDSDKPTQRKTQATTNWTKGSVRRSVRVEVTK